MPQGDPHPNPQNLWEEVKDPERGEYLESGEVNIITSILETEAQGV